MALAICTYEMMEFGEEYAKQTIANARALGRFLYERGFKVQAEEFGFTESHQLAVDVAEFGGGNEVALHLKDNGIILNMNLLPSEDLNKVTSPSGIRIGVQEMTRFGMTEPDMEEIAKAFKRCLIDGRYVGDEVKELRSRFQKIHYCFDDFAPEESMSAASDREMVSP